MARLLWLTVFIVWLRVYLWLHLTKYSYNVDTNYIGAGKLVIQNDKFVELHLSKDSFNVNINNIGAGKFVIQNDKFYVRFNRSSIMNLQNEIIDDAIKDIDVKSASKIVSLPEFYFENPSIFA